MSTDYATKDVTISPVNTAKAFCNLLVGNSFVTMQLTSSTNLRFGGDVPKPATWLAGN